MEDSGIDSGDKLNSDTCLKRNKNPPVTAVRNKTYIECSDNSSNEENFDVIFKQPTRETEATSSNTSKTQVKEKQPAIQIKKEKINTCKVLQRKLELKVERAKKNYNQLKDETKEQTSKSSTMMPINRLPIPGLVEQQPLVEYKSDSDNDEFDVSFFPNNKMKTNLKIDLSDTFSIQEMTIETDTDSDGSQNLELLSPSSSNNGNLLGKLRSTICCSNKWK